MNQSGINLIQVLVGVLLAAIFGFAISKAVQKSSIQSEALQNKAGVDGELAIALEHILRIGRTSVRCERIGADNSLECQTQGANEVTVTRNRFIVETNQLRFQRFDGAVWNTLLTYPSLSELSICGDAELSAATCGNMGFSPELMNTQHANDLGIANRNYAGRFFRFRIRGRRADGSARFLQSAFFVRNPSPLGMRYLPEVHK